MTAPAPRARVTPFGVVMTLVAVFLLYLAVPNVGPVVRAARADGVPGAFTATELSCVRHPGHESCTWWGGFRSDDGTVRHARIALYGSDRTSLRPGQVTWAVDVGRPHQVYGPGGSLEWVFTALLIAAALGILLFLYGRPRRPRTPRDAPAPHHEGTLTP